MILIVSYLVTVVKLLIVGKWSPPSHVLDVSAAQYNQQHDELVEMVSDALGRLATLEKQQEATRKKVYRDEKTNSSLPWADLVGGQGASARQLQAGEQVPSDWIQ